MDYKELKLLSKSNKEEFKVKCFDCLNGRNFISIEFFGKLYRGRLFEESQSISNASEISYIPRKEWVKGYGRANNIGQPVFYCAESYNTIFFESMLIRDGKPPSPRERIIFGEWLSIDSLNLVIIVQPEKLKRNGFFETQYGDNFDKISKGDQELIDTMKFLYQVYSERAKENSDYILPAYISNYFYQNYDGILYPSSPFTNGGYNIALKPEIKDEKLKIEKVIKHTFQWELNNEKNLIDNGELVQAKFIDKSTGEIVW